MEQVSYQTGFARYAAESEYPEFWNRLVGCWMPSLGPTGWTLFDLGPYKNHGTLTNMDPATDWVVGKFGGALDFNGSNDYVDCGNDASLRCGGQATIVTWFNPNQVGTTMAVLGTSDVTEPYQLMILSNNTIRVRFDAGVSTANSTTTSTISIGSWVCIAGVYDGSFVWIYLNGNLEGTPGALTGTLVAVDPGVFIGQRSDGYNFKGVISNVLIYNRALTAQEIQRLYYDPLCFLRRRRVKYFVVPTGAYLIAADAGNYSLTGQAVTVQRDGTIDLDAGSYSLTGQTATPLYNSQITAAPAAYNLTGQEVTLTRLAELVVDAGSYTLTGSDVDLLYGLLVSADAGSYNLTGQTVALIRLAQLVVDAGSYTLTGQDLDLLRHFLVSAEAGSYNLTGQDLDLIRLAKLVLEGASYTLTGQDLDLLHGFLFTADAGSYSITGQDVDLIRLAKLLLEAGSYTLTGQDVDLQKIIPHIIPQIMHYLRMKH